MERAARAARPFLRSPLGESLVPHLIKKVPARFRTYHESFVGAGNLFFALAPRKAYLNDKDRDVANATASSRRRWKPSSQTCPPASADL